MSESPAEQPGGEAPHPSPGFLPDVDLSAATVGVTAGEAIKLTLSGTVDRLVEEQAKVRLTADVHSVHQARVATRRLRSDLSTFGVLFEPGTVDDLREELAWMGEALGRVRNADVMAARLEAGVDGQGAPEGELDPTTAEFIERITKERGRAQLQLLAALDSERWATLLRSLATLAADPPLAAVAEAPADAFLPLIAAQPWHRLRRAVARLDRDAADGELHAVRIAAKRARYAAEAVVSVVGKPAEGFADAVADLQTALGEYNDAVASADWLRAAADDMDAPTAFAAGTLSQHQRTLAGKSRRQWPKAWKRLNRRKMRAWFGDA
jgi:CHAD domain-containing protein